MNAKGKTRVGITFALVGCFLTFGAGSSLAAKQKYVSIGTGGQTGTYYVVGQSICKMVNRASKDHGYRCSAPSTGGSIANLNSIRDGGLDLGVAQSDWQFHAYNGTSKFEKYGADSDLRSVFSVHSEPFAVVARADAGISTFEDLQDKRVNIGNPGSGQRGTMEVIMGTKGWTKKTFALASEMKTSEQCQALCDNKIDVFVHTAGVPAANIKEAAVTCDVKFIPVVGDNIDGLVNEYPYYIKDVIPGGVYKGADEDVDTMAVKATFTTSDKVHPDAVYAIVKSVFENFDRFKKLHPAFSYLDPEKMITDGLTAPLHDGAARYYKERGWM